MTLMWRFPYFYKGKKQKFEISDIKSSPNLNFIRQLSKPLLKSIRAQYEALKTIIVVRRSKCLAHRKIRRLELAYQETPRRYASF